MITLIAFVITMLGSINWLLIGLLQYDFIAGLFGFQASIFSRLIYILFGVAAVYLAIRVLVNKGTFKVFEKKKKKAEQPTQANLPQTQPAYANVEAAQEPIQNQNTEVQSKPKKKKWWQFWKKSEKKKTKNSSNQKPQESQPLDIDITLNTPQENLNTNQNRPSENLFDEHFK